MRNSIIEALEIATEEFKEEEKRRPGRPWTKSMINSLLYRRHKKQGVPS